MDIDSCTDVAVSVKRQRPGYRFSAMEYDHFQLIGVQSGQLAARFGRGTERFGAGSLVILVPGTAFDIWCDQGGFRGVTVNCMQVVSADPTMPSTSLGLPVDEQTRPALDLLERLLRRAEAGTAGAVRHLGLTLCRLACQAALLAQRGQVGDDLGYWAERVRLAIDNHLGSDLPLSAILDGLDLCYRQLTRHFITAMGMAPKQYQLLRRVEEARRLLEETALPVTTVALELGFPSSQHFATQFKRITGSTPSDFRLRHSTVPS